MNPKNAPKAAFKSFFVFEESFINSPIKAPTNGQKIIPKGPIKNPIINPIVQPQVPAFEPPNFFVIVIGKILSKIETVIAAIPVRMRIQIGVLTKEIHLPIKSPPQAKGTPGKTGTTVPTVPIIRHKIAIIKRIISTLIKDF